MIEIKPGTRRDVTYIAVNMRQHDTHEILAMLPDWMAPGQAGLLCFEATPDAFCWTAFCKGDPACAFGVAPQSPLTPWLWSAWAFGTKRMVRAVPAITRHIEQVLIRQAIEAGATRVEARSLIDHDIAHRWLAGLGATREGVCRTYGRNGEDYELWAWLKEDFDHVHAIAETGTSTASTTNAR